MENLTPPMPGDSARIPGTHAQARHRTVACRLDFAARKKLCPAPGF